MSAQTFEQLTAGLESVVTALGIIAAGVWAFFQFRRKREVHPRGSVAHMAHYLRLSDGRLVLRVSAKIANAGDVLLRLRYARTRIQQFSPIPEHIESLMLASDDPIPPDDCELPWPVLGAREWNIEEGLGMVEPGETETFCSDFVLPRHIHQVLVYTFVSSRPRGDSEFGWSDTTLVPLGGLHAAEGDHANPGQAASAQG